MARSPKALDGFNIIEAGDMDDPMAATVGSVSPRGVRTR
jgi:hypothetical protein